MQVIGFSKKRKVVIPTKETTTERESKFVCSFCFNIIGAELSMFIHTVRGEQAH